MIFDCNRPWPTVDFFVPVFLQDSGYRNSEWLDIFLRGFLLFWSVKKSQSTISLLIDYELHTQRPGLLSEHVYDFILRASAQLGSDFPQINVSFNRPRKDLYISGHDRQQYVMFYGDEFSNHSKSEYIAFMDADALLHSYVDREDVFENGKPIVHGRHAKWKSAGVDRNKRVWADSSYAAIGKQEPMSCMTYFPIIIKRKHLGDMRAHIVRYLNTSNFEDAFRIIAKRGFGSYSQFNIFCTYLFWYKRDEYTWYVHDTDPWWDGFDDKNYKPAQGQLVDKAIFTSSMLQPKPFMAAHLGGRYINGLHALDDEILFILSDSLCWRIPQSKIKRLLPPISGVSPRLYRSIKKNCTISFMLNESKGHNPEMHRFEGVDFSPPWLVNRTLITRQHDLRTARILHCNHTYILI